MTFCKVCGRTALKKGVLCQYHQSALDNLHASYENWRKASEMSWDEYIEKLCQLEETGRWVFDVAEMIRSGDDLSAPS